MTATNARGHLSSETIDLLLLSALASNEANEAKAHIDDCSLCKQRWMELNEDSQKFKQYVFARTLPAVEARLNASKQGFFERFKLRFVLPALGVATAAALALTFAAGPGTQTEDDIYIGVKGLEPTFEVFAQRQQGASFAVKAGTPLKPKDRIRFIVSPGQAKYVLVASVDGKGTFSVYHPFGSTESEKLVGKVPRRLELGSTVELDETMGTEKLVVVLSENPVKAEALKAALSESPTAPKLDGAKVLTQEFVKVAP
ncbi:MAG: hypothetical protein Q8S33_36130 [Myxococcales bacterium]|nr:hypothetical protein [Myxococcales bacterium]MDP3505829.1 hypothetical protein [Myxococcales bacterium]